VGCVREPRGFLRGQDVHYSEESGGVPNHITKIGTAVSERQAAGWWEVVYTPRRSLPQRGKNNVKTVQKLEGEALCENHRGFNAVRIQIFVISNFVSVKRIHKFEEP